MTNTVTLAAGREEAEVIPPTTSFNSVKARVAEEGGCRSHAGQAAAAAAGPITEAPSSLWHKVSSVQVCLISI